MNASPAMCQGQTGASEAWVHFCGVCLKIVHPYFIADPLFDAVFSKHSASDSQGLQEKNSLILYVIVP